LHGAGILWPADDYSRFAHRIATQSAGIHVAFNAITGQTTSHIEHAGLAEAGAVWRVYQGQKMLGCFDEEALRMQADPGRLKR